MTVKERILEYIKAKKNVNQKRLAQISQSATSYNEFKRLLIENNFTDEEGCITKRFVRQLE